MIALLVRIELEGEKYSEDRIWAPAWARIEKKALALAFKVGESKRRAESRGEEPPDFSRRGKPMAPFARFTADGVLLWDKDIVKRMKALAKPRRHTADGGR